MLVCSVQEAAMEAGKAGGGILRHEPHSGTWSSYFYQQTQSASRCLKEMIF